MTKHLKNVETFSTLFFGEGFGNTQFDNLINLHIQYFDGFINWQTFTIKNPQLKEITIEHTTNSEHFNNNDVGLITANVQLRRLRLGTNFSIEKIFYQILKMNCPDLEVQDLPNSCKLQDIDDELNDWVIRRMKCQVPSAILEVRSLASRDTSGDSYGDPYVGRWILSSA